MGWANCGQDTQGREIGYAHEAVCDHPDCNKEIDRGLAYACGGMHGDQGGQACEKYFCYEHLMMVDNDAMGFDELASGQLCGDCVEDAKAEIADLILNDPKATVVTDDDISDMHMDRVVDLIVSGDYKLEYNYGHVN